MADSPSSGKDKTTGAPAPEVLKPQAEESTPVTTETKASPQRAAVPSKRSRRGSYRPSHRATFIGLAVVIAILAINGAVIFWVMRSNGSANAESNRDEVTLSSASLDKLGVSQIGRAHV